jgi:hypothetical protein
VGERRNAYRVLVGKPDGSRPPGRYMHTWEADIKIDIKELRLESLDWINLTQDRDECGAVVIGVLMPGVP